MAGCCTGQVLMATASGRWEGLPGRGSSRKSLWDNEGFGGRDAVPGPCDTSLGTVPTSCGSSQSPLWGVFLFPELGLQLGARMGLFSGPGACDTRTAAEAPAFLQQWPPSSGPKR